MNGDNLHPYIEPELEARIVALVLGEASDFERDELDRLIAESPELAMFRKRIEAMHGLLREVAEGEQAEKKDEWKLPDKRREAVLAAIDGAPAEAKSALAEETTHDPGKAKPARGRWSGLLKIAALFCILALGATLFLNQFSGSVMKYAQRPEEDARGSAMWGFRSASEADSVPLAKGAVESMQYYWHEGASKSTADGFDADSPDVVDTIDLNVAPEVVEFEGVISYAKPVDTPVIAAVTANPRDALKQLHDTLGMDDSGREFLSREGETDRRTYFGVDANGLSRNQSLTGQTVDHAKTIENFERAEVPMPALIIEDREAADKPSVSGFATVNENIATVEMEIDEFKAGDDGDYDAFGIAAPFGGQAAGSRRVVVPMPAADGAILATAESKPVDGGVKSDVDAETSRLNVPILGDMPATGQMFKREGGLPMPVPPAPAPSAKPAPAPQSTASIAVNESFGKGRYLGGGGAGAGGAIVESAPGQMETRLKEALAETPAKPQDKFGMFLDESRSLGRKTSRKARADAGQNKDGSLAIAGKTIVTVPSDEPMATEAGGVITVTGSAVRSAGEEAKKNRLSTLGPAERAAAQDITTLEAKVPAPVTAQPMERLEELTDAKQSAKTSESLMEDLIAPESEDDLGVVATNQRGKVRGMESAGRAAIVSGTADAPVSGLGANDPFAAPEPNVVQRGQVRTPAIAGDQLKRLEKQVELQREAAKDAQTSYQAELKGLRELDLSARLGDEKSLEEVTETLMKQEAAIKESGRKLRDLEEVKEKLEREEYGRALVTKAVAPPAGLDEKKASEEAFSTFSLHVSDVSYKLAQAALAKGEWPEPGRIRIEEFVNAFDYGDPMPGARDKVACRVEQAIHPFLQQRNLLRVSMRTADAGRAANTPLRLTFLLDNSGSMERVDRQETVRRAFALLAGQLQPIDQVTLISFARQPRLLADRVTGERSGELVDLVDNLPSEGGTNLEAALQLAFEKAREQELSNAQNRVILLTDGAANLGDAKPESLARMIETMRDAGIAFDAAGIGADGLNDEILEALTRKGDGRYYLLDRPEDADAGFARQIAGALRPAAKNVKVQVEFNPKRVGNYKLLGFEKHRLAKEDFRDDSVDAAEMAAAEAGVAVYQIEPLPGGEGDVGSVSVRFRDMASGQMVEKRWPIAYEPALARPDDSEPSMRIATAAALFAAKLKGGPLGETVDLGELSRLVSGLPERYAGIDRVEELRRMIEQARSLSGE